MTARTAVRCTSALVLVAALTGCSDDGPVVTTVETSTTFSLQVGGPETASPSPEPVVTTAAPTPTPVRTPAPTVTADVPKKGSTDFGYFRAVVSDGAQAQLSFDRAVFLTGDAANKAAAEHGDETPVPNDYYVVNDNPKVRTLTLAAAVEVVGSIGLNSFADDGGEDPVAPHARTVEELLSFVDDPSRSQGTGFNLVYGDRGLVVRVEEQYVP